MSDLSEKTVEELWHEYDVAAQNMNNATVKLVKQTGRDDLALLRADESVERLDEVVGEFRNRAELYEALREALAWAEGPDISFNFGVLLVSEVEHWRNDGESFADFMVRAHRESKEATT